jgi:hypothetical protein
MNEILLTNSILSDEATAELRSALPNAPTVPPTEELPRLRQARRRTARRLHAIADRVEPLAA